MSRSVEEALARCLEKVEAGEITPEDALSRYPELRAELEPLLDLTAELRALPRIEAPARMRGYRRPVFRPTTARVAWWRRILPAGGLSLGWATPLARAAAVLAIVCLGLGGTSLAAASSLPDEPLYPVKLAAESAQLAFARDDNVRASLELQFANLRLAEVEDAARQGRAEAVEKGAELYRQKADSALKAASAASDSTDTQVEDTLRQNQLALEKVLDKVQNPKAQEAIQHAMAVSSGPTGQKDGAPEKSAKPASSAAAPAATATAVPAGATDTQRVTATPTATPGPTSGHEPPGQAKDRTEQPGNSEQGKSQGQGTGDRGQGQGLGQGQGQESKQPATSQDPSTSPTAEPASPSPTAERASPPAQSNGKGSEMGKGNGPQKSDSEPADSEGKGQKKTKEDSKDPLSALIDGIKKFVNRR